jgi:hypothetical protein
VPFSPDPAMILSLHNYGRDFRFRNLLLMRGSSNKRAVCTQILFVHEAPTALGSFLWSFIRPRCQESRRGPKDDKNPKFVHCLPTMATPKTTIIVRDYPDSRSSKEFTVDVVPDGTILRVVERRPPASCSGNGRSSSSWWMWWLNPPRQFLSDLFLPLGYPDTVPDTYLSYQLYDSLQGLCSYLRGVWCAAAVLEAAGVGDASASAWAVAITWMTKDGYAIIGGLLYSYSASHLFDGHVKEFRLLADVMNDIGLTLDMCAPHVPKHHLPYWAGTAVLCKTICGISAGATKGSITQHFAIAGNMADLNAKEATQETLMSLLGMILGVTAANLLVGHDDNHNDDHDTTEHNRRRITSWTIFIVLTIVHVWANWKGVMLLRLRTLNRARADLVFAEWLCRSAKEDGDICPEDDSGSPKKKQKPQHGPNNQEKATVSSAELPPAIRLPTPNDVHESLWASFRHILFPRSVQLGVPLSQLLQSCSPSPSTTTGNNDTIMDDLYTLAKQAEGETTTVTTTNGPDEHYVLLVCGRKNSKDQQIKVSFSTDASENTILRAYLHARLIQHGASKAAAGRLLDADFARLVAGLAAAGWDTDRFYLDSGKCRSSWTLSPQSDDKQKRE